MKKILFVINTLGTAGAEKALLELLSRLNREEYEVDLYVLMNQGELAEDLPAHVHLLNDNYDSTPVLTAEGKKHLKKYVLKAVWRNGAIFKTFPYLVKHGFGMLFKRRLQFDKLLWKTVAAAGQKNRKEYDLAVSYIEGGSAYYVNRYITAKQKAGFIHIDMKAAGYTRSLDNKCYLNFNKIFPVSDEVKDVFLELYPECADRTEVFHNLLGIESICRKAEAKESFEDSFPGKRILTIGRLHKQKAFEVSIDAMRILKEHEAETGPLRWYVLGEGDERDFLEKEITDKKLKEDFILLGNRKNPYPYLRDCDLYVHASRFEGKSIAIQEAQILAKPIVVTDCSGNREQVEDGVDGRICDFDSTAIANTVLEMLADVQKGQEMGRRAGEKIRKADSEKDTMKPIIDLL